VSFGFVLTPRFVENLSVSVDYYDIKVEDLIGQIGADLILQNCLDSGDPTYCTLVHRAANGSLWLGDQGYVIDPIVNTGSERVKGIDFEANYRMEIGSLGRLGINFVGNYVDSLDIEPLTGAPHYDCVGLYGPTCGVSTPKWSHKARVAWTTPWNIDLSATWRFKDKVQIETTSSDPGISGGVRQSDKVLGKANYLDLAGSYTYNKITARVGVNNVFDKDPPLIGANSVPSVLGSGNTLPQVYDALGRYIFFGLTADF
jgi:outer membrane receptor protein involved in Fe transport